MNQKQFDEILENRIEKIKSILGNKAKEYATDGDRLYNFKAAARMNSTTPEEALWGMCQKHLVCVMDLVSGKLSGKEMIDEKIGDMINYLILLEALLKEPLSEDITEEPDPEIKEKGKIEEKNDSTRELDRIKETLDDMVSKNIFTPVSIEMTEKCFSEIRLECMREESNIENSYDLDTRRKKFRAGELHLFGLPLALASRINPPAWEINSHPVISGQRP